MGLKLLTSAITLKTEFHYKATIRLFSLNLRTNSLISGMDGGLVPTGSSSPLVSPGWDEVPARGRSSSTGPPGAGAFSRPCFLPAESQPSQSGNRQESRAAVRGTCLSNHSRPSRGCFLLSASSSRRPAYPQTFSPRTPPIL